MLFNILSPASPNPTQHRRLNVNIFHDIYADFSDTAEKLGFESNQMCKYLDDVYVMTPDDNRGLDASILTDWKDRSANSALTRPLGNFQARCPTLLPYLAERLARDLKQLLNHSWPGLDHPLDAVSARSIMRIVILCAVIAHASKDSMCIECLRPVFPELLTNDFSLPSLRSALALYQTELAIVPPPSPHNTPSSPPTSNAADEGVIDLHGAVGSGGEFAPEESNAGARRSKAGDV